MNLKKHKKIKQFEELEISETYKESPTEKQASQQIEQEQTNSSIQNIENESKFEFDVVPIKVVALTIFLFILGILFLILGICYYVRNPEKYQQYISFLILGILMLIPGVYYTNLLIKFKKASSRSVQQQILNNLPID